MYLVEEKKEYYKIYELCANSREDYENGNHDVCEIHLIKKEFLEEDTIECLKENIERIFSAKDVEIVWQ